MIYLNNQINFFGNALHCLEKNLNGFFLENLMVSLSKKYVKCKNLRKRLLLCKMHTPKKWLKIPWINFNYHRVKIRKLPYRIKDYPLYFGKNDKFKDKTYDDNYDEIRSYCKDINFYFDELIDENDNLYDEFKFDDIYYFIGELNNFKRIEKKPYVPAKSLGMIIHNKFYHYVKIFHPWMYWKFAYVKFNNINYNAKYMK